MACMSTQMLTELKEGKPLASPPTIKKMDRGNNDDNDEDEDAWWKKPQ